MPEAASAYASLTAFSVPADVQGGAGVTEGPTVVAHAATATPRQPAPVSGARAAR